MLETVEVGSRTLRSYRGIAPNHVLDELVQALGSSSGPSPHAQQHECRSPLDSGIQIKKPPGLSSAR